MKSPSPPIRSPRSATRGSPREYDRTSDKIVHYQGTLHRPVRQRRAPARVREPAREARAISTSPAKAAIFETFRKLHPILKEQHFLNPKEEEDDPYESTQMTALIANEHGIFGVYSMREVFEYSRFWAVGSGREFALGAMHAEYAELRSRGGDRQGGHRRRRDVRPELRRCR